MTLHVTNARRRGRLIVVENWPRDTFDVYVFDRPLPHAARLLYPDGEWYAWHPEDPDTPEPTFRLPVDAAGDLVALLGDHVDAPPDADVRAHLDDSRDVRDRLLVLVEKLWDTPR